MNTLKAEKRDMQTKAKKLRREGFVTGNVFGREMKESMPIKITKNEAERFFKTCTKGSKVTLEIEGQSMPVLVKEIDYDSLKRQILEIERESEYEVYLLSPLSKPHRYCEDQKNCSCCQCYRFLAPDQCICIDEEYECEYKLNG